MLTEPSPGERLAASLRRSPIHVDPSLASALPAAERRRLLSKLRKAPTRVFVVLVPMVKGGTWTDADQLATVVHDRLGRDGIFITFDDDTENLTAREWGGDHSARDATGAVTIDRAMDDAPLAAKLGRALDLIISGTAAREYDRLSDELDKRVNARRSTRPEAAEEEDDGSLVPLGAGVAAWPSSASAASSCGAAAACRPSAARPKAFSCRARCSPRRTAPRRTSSASRRPARSSRSASFWTRPPSPPPTSGPAP